MRRDTDETIRETFASLALEVAADEDLKRGRLTPAIAYLIAAARELTLQIARVAEAMEGIERLAEPGDVGPIEAEHLKELARPIELGPLEVEILATRFVKAPAELDKLLHEISKISTQRRLAEDTKQMRAQVASRVARYEELKGSSLRAQRPAGGLNG